MDERARRLMRNHADNVEKAAGTGALAAGLGWVYFLAIFAVILVLTWVAVWFIGWWGVPIGVFVTLAIAPPLWREWRKRDEVRRSSGR